MQEKHQGIHLVTPGERHDTQNHPSTQHHPNTRLSLGNYFADIMIKREKDMCYWVIQEIGSADVVDWGNAPDFESAQSTAQQHLEALVRRAQSQRRTS